ncbi:hypothetical protein [Paenibacillus sp. RC67]|uniref:hypothetical protein n=1 Tax=Paenibacillus sp. RC67 TaxID=3039392 RepID=UPI0024AE5A53|nr:hypothetical protein [Paenibacillus sp. RC67]
MKEQQETLPPDTVHAKALWKPGNRPFDNSMWLKIELPQGDRWLLWNKELGMKVKLPTEARLFNQPSEAGEIGWLPPGNYDIVVNSGEWSCIETDSGRVWLRTSRVLLEKPLDVQAVTNLIDVKTQTITYRFPIKDEVKHQAGYYAPQKVQANGKWISDTGEIWYRFEGKEGTEWILSS